MLDGLMRIELEDRPAVELGPRRTWKLAEPWYGRAVLVLVSLLPIVPGMC